MGCTDCGSRGGCDTRKAGEREVLADVLPRLYPTRRWGEPDDALWHGAGVGADEARRFARHASEVCQAPAWYVAGADDEPCDYVHVLCVGREPGLLSLLDADAVAAPEGERVTETYLRLSLSRMLRAAALQEVRLELRLDGDLWRLTCAPQPGVYDPILLPRAQRLVELVVQHDILYFDFGLIAKPPASYAPGAWDASAYEARYGEAPATVNYLFYPGPATAIRTLWFPCAG